MPLLNCQSTDVDGGQRKSSASFLTHQGHRNELTIFASSSNMLCSSHPSRHINREAFSARGGARAREMRLLFFSLSASFLVSHTDIMIIFINLWLLSCEIGILDGPLQLDDHERLFRYAPISAVMHINLFIAFIVFRLLDRRTCMTQDGTKAPALPTPCGLFVLRKRSTGNMNYTTNRLI